MSDSANSQEPVFRPSGNSEWLIPAEITKAIPEFKGKIVCDAEAYAHIEAGHREQIRRFGYADAVAFVAYTLSHVSAIYEVKDKDGKPRHVPVYDLIANVSTQGENLNRVMAYLKETPEGNFYDVSTAHVIHNHRYKNRTPLWVYTPYTLRAVTNLNLPTRTVPNPSKADDVDDDKSSKKVK